MATNVFFRGSTIHFSTVFYDYNKAVVQPSAANAVITYPTPDGEVTVTLPMTAPASPATNWTLDWDTRDISPGVAFYSIHSEGGPPFGVEDGSITLTANAANPLTFV